MAGSMLPAFEQVPTSTQLGEPHLFASFNKIVMHSCASFTVPFNAASHLWPSPSGSPEEMDALLTKLTSPHSMPRPSPPAILPSGMASLDLAASLTFHLFLNAIQKHGTGLWFLLLHLSVSPTPSFSSSWSVTFLS